jgi:hypothetical protein
MSILLLAAVVGTVAAVAAIWLAMSLLRGRGERVAAGGMATGAAGAAIPPRTQTGPVVTRSRPAPERPPPPPAPPAPAVVEAPPRSTIERDPAPQPLPEPEPPPAPAQLRWWTAFDARSQELDARSRLRLIGDLGVVGKDWCVPLLAQAYAEESDSGHRQAALIALAACRSRDAVATFRQALLSKDAAEKAIAADALADLEPPPQVRRPHTVERY